jgi:hypothetical protein
MLTIIVVTDVKGAKGAEEKTKVELAQDPPVLRDLIAAKIRVEVSEWQTRSRRLFGREWATENDLKFQKGPGEVKILARWEAPPVDAEREVKKALDAFAKGKYTVFFAERKINSIDERVPGDRMIRFVRESPLPKI